MAVKTPVVPTVILMEEGSATMEGTGSEMVIVRLKGLLVPPGPVALSWTVALGLVTAVGVPEMTPVVLLRTNPLGSAGLPG